MSKRFVLRWDNLRQIRWEHRWSALQHQPQTRLPTTDNDPAVLTGDRSEPWRDRPERAVYRFTSRPSRPDDRSEPTPARNFPSGKFHRWPTNTQQRRDGGTSKSTRRREHRRTRRGATHRPRRTSGGTGMTSTASTSRRDGLESRIRMIRMTNSRHSTSRKTT